MKSSKKIALAGIFTALAVVFLFIGSIIKTLDLSAAAIGSIVILIALSELGKGWAFGIYAATSLLGLLLLPDKAAAAIFALFAGFYPIIKVWLNAIGSIILSYTARIAVFNVFLTALIYIGSKFLGIQEDYLSFEILLYGLANVTFIVYDLALERITVFYGAKLRKMLFKSR